MILPHEKVWLMSDQANDADWKCDVNSERRRTWKIGQAVDPADRPTAIALWPASECRTADARSAPKDIGKRGAGN